MSPRLCITMLLFQLSVDFVLSADYNDCISFTTDTGRSNSNPSSGLILKCQVDRCIEVNNLKPQSIKISKVGDDGDIRLASIEKIKNVAGRDIELGETPKVSGNMKDNRNAYLAIQWEHPDQDLEGQYSCATVVVDKSGQKRTLGLKYYLTVMGSVHPNEDPTDPTKTANECEKQMAKEKENTGSLKERVKELEQELAEKESKGGDTLEGYKRKLAEMFFIQDPLVYNKKTYYISLRSFVNDAESDNNCNIVGGYLAEINDADEYRAIVKYVRSNAVRGALISGTDVVQDGVWLSQRSKKPVKYFIWASGEPNNYNGKEDCIVIWSDKNYLMNDESCSNSQSFNFPYICEVDQ